MSNKRKREKETKYYAVRAGKVPGIYTLWSDCVAQVTGFSTQEFKSFKTIEEAQQYMKGHNVPASGSKQKKKSVKFYGVARGRRPGVYTTWEEAQKQIKGWSKPKYRAFNTRAEAEAFSKEKDDLTEDVEDDEEVEPPRSKRKMDNEGGTVRAGANGTAKEDVSDEDEDEDDDEDEDEYGSFDEDDVAHAIELQENGVAAKKSTQTVPTTKKDSIKVYTDGSAMGNGKASAKAGIGVWFGHDDVRNVSEPLSTNDNPTNNRAELTAILRALEIVPLHNDIVIYTDSKYSINCVTIWFQKWRANGWKTGGGKGVENRDLVEAIVDRIQERLAKKNAGGGGAKTKFEWVNGHTGNVGNEAADRLAVSGALRYGIK